MPKVNRPKLGAKRKTVYERCWKLMSEYTRRKNADSAGFVSCVCCGNPKPWKEIHAGHYLHAGNGGHGNAVSYDERNVHPECTKCNTYDTSGEAKYRYDRFIRGKYGDILDELKAIKAQSRLSLDDLLQIEQQLKAKLSDLRS